MIKANNIIVVVVILLLTLCSCTNEVVEDAPDMLLKRIVEVAIDETSTTTTLVYDGNKIRHIDKADLFTEFFYTADLITKVIETDKSTLHKNNLDLLYSEGKLIKIISSDNYVLNYIYNDNQTVSYEKVTKDSQNNVIKLYHGTLYYENENLIKDEKIFDDTADGNVVKKTINNRYDDKKNPLSLILGFNKLLNYFGSISKNNTLIRTEEMFLKQMDSDQVISTIVRYDSDNEYNSKGYPTEIFSETLIFGSSDSKHLKSQLFYN